MITVYEIRIDKCIVQIGQTFTTIKFSGAWSLPSHYMNQWWFTVNLTNGNLFQWNTSDHSNIFIQENAFVNVMCEMVAFRLGLNVKSFFYQYAPQEVASILIIAWISEKIHRE